MEIPPFPTQLLENQSTCKVKGFRMEKKVTLPAALLQNNIKGVVKLVMIKTS